MVLDLATFENIEEAIVDEDLVQFKKLANEYTIDDFRQWDSENDENLIVLAIRYNEKLDIVKYLHEQVGYTLADIRANDDLALTVALEYNDDDFLFANWLYETYYKPNEIRPNLAEIIRYLNFDDDDEDSDDEFEDSDEEIDDSEEISMKEENWLHEKFDLTIDNLHKSLFMYALIHQLDYFWKWAHQKWGMVLESINCDQELLKPLMSTEAKRFFEFH